ncbi:MAG: CHAT domain-containing protein [Pirellulaceae bacterium]
MHFNSQGEKTALHRFLRVILFLPLIAISLPAHQARSQNLNAVPRQEYFLAKAIMRDGDFVRASRGFESAARSGIRSTEGRWVDSICYYAMMGECYYQMGRTAEALERFEAALQLYVAHQNWLLALDYPPAIQLSGRARRPITWAISQRTPIIGQVPGTINSLQGRLNNLQVLAQGGVYVPLQLFPIHAEEIVQCTALAMRRRLAIMGPTCPYSPLTLQLLNALSRRPTRPNHWSQAWVSLQLGLAYASAGQTGQAAAQLQQSMLISGRFDHVLTSVAMLELGKLAFQQEQFPQAASYFIEASLNAGLFEEYRTVEESLRWASRTHQVVGGKGLFAPLPAAAAWGQTESDFVQASVFVSAAENYGRGGEPAKAMAMIDRAATAARRHDMANGTLSARVNYVTALANYQMGNLDLGDAAFSKVMAFQKQSSHWLLQVAQTDALFNAGALSEKVADDLFSRVLREPTSADWVFQPEETLTYLLSPHLLPMEHWFQVVMQRKELERAIEISDRIRRHRFYSSLPMGGRLLSLRWTLEAPEDAITPKALLQRRDLLANYPKYGPVRERARMVSQQLQQMPIGGGDEEQVKQGKELYGQLTVLARAQEIMMREMSLQGDAAQFCFPRIRDVKELQRVIPEGEMVLVFFATSRGMLVFALGNKKYEYWQLASLGKITGEMKTLLRQLGHFDKNVDVKVANLATENWKESASRITEMLFSGAPPTILDNVTRLVIVPDGPLWYLPFEALLRNDQPLLQQLSIRYSPYVSLAMGDGRNHPPLGRTGFVSTTMVPGEDKRIAAQGAEQFIAEIEGSDRLSGDLPGPSSVVSTIYDRLFVMAELDDMSKAPYNLAPLSLDRGRPGSNLGSWMALPWGRCQQVALPAFHTAAENSLKRGGNGMEVFLTINGLMASGARTVVLSRWRPGGKTSHDLMRKLAAQLPEKAADTAWQQVVMEMRQELVDTDLEPRISGTANDRLLANHPWFWAGYIVADTKLTPGQPQPVATVPDALPPGMKKKPAAAGNKNNANDANNNGARGALPNPPQNNKPAPVNRNVNNPFGQAPNPAQPPARNVPPGPPPKANPLPPARPGEPFKFKPPSFIKPSS